MIEVRQTEAFRHGGTGFATGRRIADRIAHIQGGLIGDVKMFGGLIEFRIDHGPGYRLYAVRRGEVLVILLCGGDKIVAEARHSQGRGNGGRTGVKVMALESFPVDLAPFYDSEEAQEELLNDALATGHAGYIANALGIIARARGMSGLAAETGVKRQQLYRALSEDGNPTLETLTKVIRALGYRLTATSDRAEAA